MRTATIAVLLVLLLVAGLQPVRAAAQTGSNELSIVIGFPDDGLFDGEQLCLALYPGDTQDFSDPPLQSRCLDPGSDVATFSSILPGTYQLVTPSVGSMIDQNRYQAQSAETSIPEESVGASFEANLPLALTPELSGTTGQVQVNVYGCPPGTDGQGDATLWQSQCTSPVAGVSLALQGIGSIGDTSHSAVTSTDQSSAGKVEFTNLPPGEYQLSGVDSSQFVNVESNPALVVQSNIDGSLGVVDPEQGISLRPAEIKNIDIYLVLSENSEPMVISPLPASVAIGAPTGSFASANPSTASTRVDLASLNPGPTVSGALPEGSVSDAVNQAPTPES